MNIVNKISKYVTEHLITPADKVILDEFSERAVELESFDTMKATQGWRVLNKKFREELRTRILDAIAKDERSQVILDILAQVETKTKMKLLEEELDNTLPK